MTYDISFKYRAEDIAEYRPFVDWLENQPNTTKTKNTVDYYNPDTDVFFQIFWYLPAQHERNDIEDDGSFASFALNYNRPTSFVLEAVEFVEKMCKANNLLIRDHQDTDEWVEHEPNAIIKRYRRASTTTMHGLLRAKDLGFDVTDRPRLPTDQLDAIWRWNYSREAKIKRCEEYGRNIFVPLLELITIGYQTYSYVGWFDGINQLFPPSDLIGLARNKYRIKTSPIFGFHRPTLDFVRRSEIDPIFARTYQTDPNWPQAISARDHSGQQGQQEFLARKPGTNSMADYVYTDKNYYRNLTEKPFQRHGFSNALDAHFFPNVAD